MIINEFGDLLLLFTSEMIFWSEEIQWIEIEISLNEETIYMNKRKLSIHIIPQSNYEVVNSSNTSDEQEIDALQRIIERNFNKHSSV